MVLSQGFLRFVFCLQLIIFFTLSHQYAFAQSAKDVYKGLRKIDMHLELGATFRDYLKNLTDVRMEMELLLDSQGKKPSALIDHLKNTIKYYVTAGIIWKTIIDGSNRYGIVRMSRETAKRLALLIPEIRDDLEAEISSTSPQVMIKRSEIEPSMHTCWKNASKELILIRNMLQKGD